MVGWVRVNVKKLWSVRSRVCKIELVDEYLKIEKDKDEVIEFTPTWVDGANKSWDIYLGGKCSSVFLGRLKKEFKSIFAD